MPAESHTLFPLLLGVFAGVLALGGGLFFARRLIRDARARARALMADVRQEAEARKTEILVAAQEGILAQQEEADRRDRDLDEREGRVDERTRQLDRDASDLGRQRKQLDRRVAELDRRERQIADNEQQAGRKLAEASEVLERAAGMTHEQARDELIRAVEQEARAAGERLARKIEEDARESAERRAVNLMIQASQRVKIHDVVESTVSFLELPSDEMKGRIIGREGRNIRALEMATGIDLVVDDTPRSILISSFDPVRREIARIAIDKLVEDGRIHPARIEEVVQRVGSEIEEVIEQKGAEAAYALGISDLHPRLIRLVGRMRYHTTHGQNLLQHCVETALIAGFMAQEVGAAVEVAQRAGLLHEIGQVESSLDNHPALAAAEICAKFQESEEVQDAIRSFHPDVEARTVESILVNTAGRMSDNRPGARKENLAVFIERLKRLEGIATGFPGVSKAYAVKAGKEIRVIVDARETTDKQAYGLCKQIAKAVERELSYPGQIKVGVIRETRAVRFAL